MLTPEEIVFASLEEDKWLDDVTSELLCKRLDDDPDSVLKITSKEKGVFSGLRWLHAFKQFEEFDLELHCFEGNEIEKGSVLAIIRGPFSLLLAVERTLLNGLQNYCGIATYVDRFVKKRNELSKARNIPEDAYPQLLHTRKTTPLLRVFQLDAVKAGGGAKHRDSLESRIMFKDNHKEELLKNKMTYASLFECMTKTQKEEALFEVDSIKELQELCSYGLKNVLLDNFSEEDLKKALKFLRGTEVEVEVSGGIHINNLEQYVYEGVHRISIGSFTHSFPALDISAEYSS